MLAGGQWGIGLRTETADDYGDQIPGAGLEELVSVEGCCQCEEDDEDEGGC